MNNLRLIISFLVLSVLFSCASNQTSDYVTSDSVSVTEFSSSVEMLISNTNFLENEILKINAKNPSVQRILVNSDIYLKDGKLIQANSELERALRITKEESAIYLRFAHLRLIQGLLTESKSFASRALLIKEISSWERLLLNVYLKRPN